MDDSGSDGEWPSTHLGSSRIGQSPRTRTVSTTDRSDMSGREAATGFAGRVESHPKRKTSLTSYVARSILFKIEARRRMYSPPAGHETIQLGSRHPREPSKPDRMTRLPSEIERRRPDPNPVECSHTTATLLRGGDAESGFDKPHFRCAWSLPCRTEPPRADRPRHGERAEVKTKTAPPGALARIRRLGVIAYSAGGADSRDRSTA